MHITEGLVSAHEMFLGNKEVGECFWQGGKLLHEGLRKTFDGT